MIDKKDLSYNNAVRALLCMMPMVFAFLTDNVSWIVPMGQAGFFNSTMPLAKTRLERVIAACLMLAPGMGFYLIGGNTAEYFWFALLFALAIGLACSLLTNFRYLGMVAIAGFIPIYTAGLNAGSSEKAASAFMIFAFTLAYCGLVSLLPFWKGRASPNPVIEEADRAIMGVKMGVGMALSLGISMFFNFGKLGWAPSAVGSVIRTDSIISKKRSYMRAAAVIGGAIMASIAIYFIPNPQTLVIVVLALSILNGFTAFTKLGQLPLLYNAVILILYSQTSATPTEELINTRIIYNLVGIMVALAVVYYPMPYLAPKIRAFYKELARTDASAPLDKK